MEIIALQKFSNGLLGNVEEGQVIDVTPNRAKILISSGLAKSGKSRVHRQANYTINKPVVILGQGPSSRLLERNIGLFRDKDVFWASMNRYIFQEREILGKIRKRFNMIWCSSNVRFNEMRNHLKESAKDGALIMTTTHTYLRIDFQADVYVSDIGIGISSLFAMLCALGTMGANDIYLIGFDGYATHPGQVYYGQHKINDDFIARQESIQKDTKVFNKMFWDYFEKTVYRTRDEMRIHNLTGSKISCFKKMTIKQMANQLGEVTANA